MLSLIFTGCSKKGDTGPAGPQGPAGTNGTNGQDGNANVAGSNSVAVSNWSYDNTTNAWTAQLQWPSITQAIVDKGSVQVFIGNGTAAWSALTYVDGNLYCGYGFTVGYVNLFISTTDGSLANNPGTLYFRIVAISASQKAAHPNTNWKNYDEVMSIVNETTGSAK